MYQNIRLVSCLIPSIDFPLVRRPSSPDAKVTNDITAHVCAALFMLSAIESKRVDGLQHRVISRKKIVFASFRPWPSHRYWLTSATNYCIETDSHLLIVAIGLNVLLTEYLFFNIIIIDIITIISYLSVADHHSCEVLLLLLLIQVCFEIVYTFRRHCANT